MRLVRFLFCYVLLSVVGVILALILAQNWGTTQVTFFGLDYSVHLALLLAGSAVVGALVMLVLLLPGRLAAMVHRWGMERELRQWEQDLWKLQEQYGRLLNRHERLLDAHERVLQAHHSLVGAHSQVAAERDEIRAQLTQLAAARTSATHQPARISSVPHVAVVSSGGRSAITVTSRPHTHDVRGGKASVSAPRWAVPCPPARPAAVSASVSAAVSASTPTPTSVPKAHESGELPQKIAEDEVASEAAAAMTVTAAFRRVTVEQPVERPVEPAPAVPAVTPLLAASAAEERAAEEPAPPRIVPVLSTEALASVPPATPTASAAPAASPIISLRALRRAADWTIVSMSACVAALRRWLRTTFARMMTALAGQRTLLEAQWGQLKRSFLQGGLPLDSDASRTSSTPIELPSGDERGV